MRIGFAVPDEQGGLRFLRYRDVEALVDAGAAMSCIDQDLALELQLPLVGKHPVSGVGGLEEFPECLCTLYVPKLGAKRIGKLAAVKLAAGRQRHWVLLGRDFLRIGSMMYDGRKGAVLIQTGPLGLARNRQLKFSIIVRHWSRVLFFCALTPSRSEVP